MPRSTKHAKELPTKEKFFQTVACSGDGWAGLGGFYGCEIDGDAEYSYITCHVPHDFNKIVSLVVAIIPRTPLAEMTMTVMVNYAHKGAVYSQHNKTLTKTFLAADNTMTEVDITDLVDLPNATLEMNDYLGIQVSRAAGQNTDALILGARLKYK